MGSIAFINTLILGGAMLLLAGILSSVVATRFGAPLLLVFLCLGMVAGEDGPGGIVFSDYRATYLVGSVALAIILFDGGMRTPATAFRVALRPALLLATAGVLITAAVTGVVAHLVLTIAWPQALLIGAITASTDAAAVLFLIHTRGVRLNQRVGMTLEIESGINDPVAVFLTITVVQMIALPAPTPLLHVFATLAEEAVVGAVVGLLGGLAISRAMNALPLPTGLQPLFVATGAVFIFALAQVAGGSGFLAVYLGGLVVGNRPLRAHANVMAFHDAASWFCQLVMFLVLGLLVTPMHLLHQSPPALVIALGLMLVARPLAVFLCLKPFRFSLREIAFISWVGLRGAVSIFLASVPMLTGLPSAELYFNVAFITVLVSLLVQGWSLPLAARGLDVTLPQPDLLSSRVELDLPGQLELELVGYTVPADAPVLNGAALPGWGRRVMVVRRGEILDAAEAGALRARDYAYFLAPPSRIHLLDRFFATGQEAADDQSFFGEFAFAGSVTLGQLEALYGLPVPAERQAMTLSHFFAEELNEHPIIGDRLTLGGSALIVREVEGDEVTRVGLQLERVEPPHPWRERLLRLLRALRPPRS
jgi:potassium/hydrogen antiporter